MWHLNNLLNIYFCSLNFRWQKDFPESHLLLHHMLLQCMLVYGGSCRRTLTSLPPLWWIALGVTVENGVEKDAPLLPVFCLVCRCLSAGLSIISVILSTSCTSSIVTQLQVSDFHSFVVISPPPIPFFPPCRKLDAFIYDAAVLNYMARKDEGCKVRNRSLVIWQLCAATRSHVVAAAAEVSAPRGYWAQQNHQPQRPASSCGNRGKKHNKHGKWALLRLH